MLRRTLATLLALLCLGCANARFDVPGAADEAAFVAEHPLYAEYCALSQIKKKPGFGADIRGEIGGHAVFYLNGACRDDAAHYPVLRPCAPGEPDGVGLSMNAHFRNAKWVATPGRDFFFHGGMAPDDTLDRTRYAAIRDEARRRGIYDGVVFNDWVFADKPPAGPTRTGATRSPSPPTGPSPSDADATASASPSPRRRCKP